MTEQIHVRFTEQETTLRIFHRDGQLRVQGTEDQDCAPDCPCWRWYGDIKPRVAGGADA